MALDVNSLEKWLWDAACIIRGEVDAPKYKDYILPLIFLKRISDVYEDEIEKLAKKFGSMEMAEEVANNDHNVVSFYIPKEARWQEFRKITVGIGEYLTKAVRNIAKENPQLNGVIDIVDYNATTAGQRIISDEKLVALIDILSKHRIGLEDTQPDIIGRAYEYMLRKFAEGSGSSAGEFHTPPEVSRLMARIIDPEPGNSIYDPCCGSAGLLIKSFLRFKEKYPDTYEKKGIHFYGQEINPLTYAMAKMNSFIYKMDIEIALRDSMNRPAFKTRGGALKQFDKLVANPMWNQKFPVEVYENDSYGRFSFGYPPKNTADWGWVQHMYASINEKGKLAVVLDTGAVSRGSGNVGSNKERDIRKKFIEKDLIECVILLPKNMFYNTTAPGIILILNNQKKKKNEILLINASNLFRQGKTKNYLTEDAIKKISTVYSTWKEVSGVSKVITKDVCCQNDYNLYPSRFISQNKPEEILSLNKAITNLRLIEKERAIIDNKLNRLLMKINSIKISDEEIITKVETSIEKLMKIDAELFFININERTITHKLAEYLQQEFLDYNVDCEYNRHFDKLKELDLPTDRIDWNDTEAKTVFQDIIIHRRNSDINLVVIEIKKSSNRTNRQIDINKLVGFTKDPFSYELGLFIEFNMRDKTHKIVRFKDGKELK